MNAIPHATRGFAGWRLARPTDRTILLAGCGLALALQLALVFSLAVNWDEFFFHSRSYQLIDGALASPFQSINARLFAWLAFLPGNEIAQIHVGRLVMLGCEMVVAACIARCVAEFASRNTALLAALLYLTGGFVFLHGFSFRFDPLAAALLMCAFTLMLCHPLRIASVAGIALLIGLAGMVTIKSALYAPAFAGIALWRLREDSRQRRQFARFAAIVLFSLVAFLALLALHAATLPTSGEANRALGAGFASSAGHVFSEGFAPQGRYVVKQFLLAPVLMATIAAAPVLIARSTMEMRQRLALLLMWSPILLLAFYTNAFPYFYVFLLPPVVVAGSLVVASLLKRYGALPVTVVLCGLTIVVFAQTRWESAERQAEFVSQVHRVFPEPVAYIDFSSMIPSHRKQGFFMSGWGMKAYREAGDPVYAEILRQSVVPYVIANHVGLAAALEGRSSVDPLLDDDARVLRENYIRHWGLLWVAGKRIAPEAKRIEILVPGTYTVEGAGVTFAKGSYDPGDVVTLERGAYSVEVEARSEATLRWGKDLYRPTSSPPTDMFDVFQDF